MYNRSHKNVAESGIKVGQKFWVYRRRSGWSLLTCAMVQGNKVLPIESGVFPNSYFAHECFLAIPKPDRMTQWRSFGSVMFKLALLVGGLWLAINASVDAYTSIVEYLQ